MRKIFPNLFLILTTMPASFSPVFVSAVEAQASNPNMVNIPGAHQDELGCPGEWQPDCEATLLTYDIEDDVWQGTYEIQPANDGDKKGPRYKAALLALLGLGASCEGRKIKQGIPKFYFGM